MGSRRPVPLRARLVASVAAWRNVDAAPACGGSDYRRTRPAGCLSLGWIRELVGESNVVGSGYWMHAGFREPDELEKTFVPAITTGARLL